MATIKSNLNIKIDADVKERASQILGQMGIDQTTAINMFFRQIIKEHRLPFQPSAVEPTLDEQLIAAIKAKNKPSIKLEVDENGNIIIDKERHPQLYDWAVNG